MSYLVLKGLHAANSKTGLPNTSIEGPHQTTEIIFANKLKLKAAQNIMSPYWKKVYPNFESVLLQPLVTTASLVWGIAGTLTFHHAEADKCPCFWPKLWGYRSSDYGRFIVKTASLVIIQIKNVTDSQNFVKATKLKAWYLSSFILFQLLLAGV